MYAPDGTPIPKDIEAEVKHILDAPRDRGIVHPDTSEWDRAIAFVQDHGGTDPRTTAPTPRTPKPDPRRAHGG